MGDARAVVDEFHRRQAEMYAGGNLEAVAELLADDVVWHVPGSSPIAGHHRGRDAVLAYFRRRRELAGGTMRMTRRDVMSDEEVVVMLVDGEADLGGEPARWRTVGVYRVRDGRLAEAWLVPLELDQFDALWSH